MLANMYYTEPNTFIRIHIVYLNDNNHIEKLIKETVLLKDPGLISKDELTTIINNYSNETYSIHSILKINVNVNPDDLTQFIQDDDQQQEINDYLFIQEISNEQEIDTIYFENSISMFHDINNLFILFQNNLKQ
jgi:hypothetical protein